MGVFDLRVGDSATIVKINIDGGAYERLHCLGFQAGAKVTVLSFSLFKSCVLLGVGQTRVAIRRGVASLIEVSPIEVSP
jgi:Fe2+ transport system protein FeoA